jgi:hypothetical protein
MSQESLKKFFEEFETNEALKSQIKEAVSKLPEAEANDEAKQASILAECAKKAGYDVTAEELLALKPTDDSSDEKLCLDDLDAVVGGGAWEWLKGVATSVWNFVKKIL